MALLAAEAFRLGHRDALQADFLQRFFDFVELERLYDSLDLFHLFGLHFTPYRCRLPVCTGHASHRQRQKSTMGQTATPELSPKTRGVGPDDWAQHGQL